METNRVQFDTNAVNEKVNNNSGELNVKLSDLIKEKLDAGDGNGAFRLIGSGIDNIRKNMNIIHNQNTNNMKSINDKLTRLEDKLDLIDQKLTKLQDNIDNTSLSPAPINVANEITYEDLYKMHEAGKSYQKIADLTNIEKETVRYRINAYKKKHGILP